MTHDPHDEVGDALPPPFRPWQRGVPQPGADRPESLAPATGELGSRRGRVPPPPVPPEQTAPAAAPPSSAPVQSPSAAPPVPPQPASAAPGPQWYAPVHRPVVPPASPVQPASGSRTVGATLRRDRYVVGLAIVSALSAWLPWFKSPGASMFETGGGSGLFATATVNAWDLPAKYLWATSRGFSNGGIELGWLVVGLPVLMIVACIRGWSSGAIRGLAGVQAGVAVLFMAQTYRIIHDTTGPVRIAVSYGTTDLLGLGSYVLLALSLALLLAPRR
jgi:hypothetical protein